MKTSISSVLAFALLAGCASMDNGMTSSSRNTAAQSAPPAGPNDAQIAAIVVAANTVDINNGKLAQSKTQNEQVRQVADQMVADHTQVNNEAVALVTKLGVTPEESETSRSLTDGGAKNIAKLQGLSGAEFDRAYTDNEVTYHEAVLKAVDTVLIPNAQNAELKQTLINVRPTFEGHLAHAKMVQASLARRSM